MKKSKTLLFVKGESSIGKAIRLFPPPEDREFDPIVVKDPDMLHDFHGFT